MEGLNTRMIDINIHPGIIRDFISAYFPNAPRIPRAEAWQRFREFYQANSSNRHFTPGKSAFFYAMHRDGWTDQRTKATTYFLSPDAEKPHRGRRPRLKANQETTRTGTTKADQEETAPEE